jgi:hypothetical protein
VSSALHRLAAIVLLVVLACGGCLGCPEPVVKASTHACCDPDGDCKPELAASDCDIPDSVLPDGVPVTPQFADAGSMPVLAEALPTFVSAPVFADTAPSPPLRI